MPDHSCAFTRCIASLKVRNQPIAHNTILRTITVILQQQISDLLGRRFWQRLLLSAVTFWVAWIVSRQHGGLRISGANNVLSGLRHRRSATSYGTFTSRGTARASWLTARSAAMTDDVARRRWRKCKYLHSNYYLNININRLNVFRYYAKQWKLLTNNTYWVVKTWAVSEGSKSRRYEGEQKLNLDQKTSIRGIIIFLHDKKHDIYSPRDTTSKDRVRPLTHSDWPRYCATAFHQ